ncbi:LytR C-terminal domain-containing protein [Georgenia muralis]|uniref:LytR C-terminal domain-containing protein n=1 Tax=Georgenia muralis TaxID=154117 RepID=UPI000F4DA179|nr:LytR C-terminal domain-containing protein [Georgenia muralis]
MSTHHEDYEDEFDVAGRDRAPEGVHRSPRPLWRALLPVVAVIVLAPLLAWGAISLLGGGEDPTAAPTVAATSTAVATEGGTDSATEGATEGGTATAEPTGGASEEPTGGAATQTPEETEPAAGVELGTPIAVLNGAGVGGLAGQVVDQLAAEGFTGGIPDNYASATPATTTLYYNNAGLQATAEEVASVLGITNLVESASATQAIAIVLRADFTG